MYTLAAKRTKKDQGSSRISLAMEKDRKVTRGLPKLLQTNSKSLWMPKVIKQSARAQPEDLSEILLQAKGSEQRNLILQTIIKAISWTLSSFHLAKTLLQTTIKGEETSEEAAGIDWEETTDLRVEQLREITLKQATISCWICLDYLSQVQTRKMLMS